MERLNFERFAAKYYGTTTPSSNWLRSILEGQRKKYPSLDGWMLLECQMLGSSHMGEPVILPYGPENTFKTIPDYPISPRGLASDMSVVVAYLPIELFPLE